MMDCPTREENQKLQSEEEEGQEKGGRTDSLYLYLHASSLDGNVCAFYKIDSSEPNFSQKPKMIPENTPNKDLRQQIACGSAICGSILYLFGGWKDGNCMMWSKKAFYLDLASSHTSFVPLKRKMRAFRALPMTLTIGKKIYIFGSQQAPGFGQFPLGLVIWGEVFNTESKCFKPLSSPPSTLFEMDCLGVTAVIEENKILIATNNFSDYFIYNVESDFWVHTPTNTVSPFQLCSMKSPVIGNYIFLYGTVNGTGRICAFDMDKNQFLKNDISLLEWALFYEDTMHGPHGVIHHLGGWKFCVVFNGQFGCVVTAVHVVSFEIENPERCGELNIMAGTVNVVDHLLGGHTFVDSLLLSNQIVHSGNPNNGKRSHKNNLIVGVASHVDDDCVMDDYGATSRPDISKLHMKVAELSKLRRKEAILDKELLELRLKSHFWRLEIDKLKYKLPISSRKYNYYLDELEKLKRRLSKTNMDDCIKLKNVSEIKNESVEEEISSLERKIEAQLTERENLQFYNILPAVKLVTSCLSLIN